MRLLFQAMSRIQHSLKMVHINLFSINTLPYIYMKFSIEKLHHFHDIMSHEWKINF